MIQKFIISPSVIPSVEAKRKLMKLSQNMVRTYCLTISNSYGQALSESPKETVRITTRKVCGGVVLCGVSTTLLPYSHHQVFDLLRHDHGRSQVKDSNPKRYSTVSCVPRF